MKPITIRNHVQIGKIVNKYYTRKDDSEIGRYIITKFKSQSEASNCGICRDTESE
jgi:hypothetical protein